MHQYLEHISYWALTASPIDLLILKLAYCAAAGLSFYMLFAITVAIDTARQPQSRQEKK